MREHQQIEWKESWRDEYLRWICGFANAEGGRLHIGRNERGVQQPAGGRGQPRAGRRGATCPEAALAAPAGRLSGTRLRPNGTYSSSA